MAIFKSRRLALLLSLWLFVLYSKNAIALAEWEKLPIEVGHINSVETTPWGIMAGEFDTRVWQKPFNGIYISTDKGFIWKESGLGGRGVTDIAYENKVVYASTYYFVDNTAGLFVSIDGGKSWSHIGYNFSTSCVTAHKGEIYVGTYSHGLWKATDGGNNFVQLVGTGFYGPEISAINVEDNLILVTGPDMALKSFDSGTTWVEITEFEGSNVKTIASYKNIVLAGADTGIFRSTDSGDTWEHSQNIGGKVSKIFNEKDAFYLAISEDTPFEYQIYSSIDFGLSWESLNFSSQYSPALVTDIAWLFSDPEEVFISVLNNGLYKVNKTTPLEQNPLFEIPWDIQNEFELTDTITSFFDHTYPLLGYGYFNEPPQESLTTTNYLGMKAAEPTLYYSQHDGIDFGLPYGTEITAVAKGMASYGYDADGLGHHIKVKHNNGYETTYAHLQQQDLITTSAPISVEEGEKLGRVGMSGNTSGPHLHFSVLKDKNDNNNMFDDTPSGKVDPFGWQNTLYADPWATFSWTDIKGTHTGTISSYLWRLAPVFTSRYINEYTNKLELDRLKLKFESNTTKQNITVFVRSYAPPKFPIEQNKLTYLSGSSFLINMYGNLGEEIPELLKPVRIEIDISNADLKNIKENTLSIYYWSEETQLWEKIPTVVDLVKKVAIGETMHFSNFAVVGEKIDSKVPNTNIKKEGILNDDWYIEYPTITLTTAEDTTIYYSIDKGFSWNEYTNRFLLQNEGIVSLWVKSVDNYDNWEETNKTIVKIDTQNRWKDKVIIRALLQ